MATRRMFSKTITCSARFLKMPQEAQNLYFHLCMSADDDGVVEAFTIMQMLGSSEDVIKNLVGRSFVQVLNEDMVSYIMDWNEHNLIRADRKVNSVYKDLLVKILPEAVVKEPKPRADTGVITRQNVTGRPVDRIGKDRLDKVSIGKDSTSGVIDFNSFWSIYPKKADKKKAEAKWSKLTEETKKIILEDIPKRKDGRKWKAGFIENPMTYLNGERWNDEIEKSTKMTLQAPTNKYANL